MSSRARSTCGFWPSETTYSSRTVGDFLPLAAGGRGLEGRRLFVHGVATVRARPRTGCHGGNSLAERGYERTGTRKVLQVVDLREAGIADADGLDVPPAGEQAHRREIPA